VGAAAGKIIHERDLTPLAEQFVRQIAADKPAAAGDEPLHGKA
jgi:hypothetical protein